MFPLIELNMKNFRLLLVGFFILHHGQSAVWKTEEAYIIDDLPDHNINIETLSATTCLNSKGSQGQCMPLGECNRNYRFLETSPPETISPGLLRQINGADLEPCSGNPRSKSGNSSSTVYVCCTSVEYSNSRNITLDEYNLMQNETSDIPEELMAATGDPVVPNIVMGDVARVGEFPFTVAIIFNGHQICGGSLIDSQWIVSAAHCFDRFDSSKVRSLVIKLGDHDISTTTDTRHQDIKVGKLFLHPGFFRQKGYFKDDIALVKLTSPVSPSPNIQRVTLHAGSPSISGPHTTATVAGWGKVCGGAQCPQSSVLRKAGVGLISQTECSQRYAGTQAPPITQNMICAGGTSGKDSCNGDSGGPLVINSGGQTYQIGIVSWGIGCGQYPGVYTRVSSFVNWVQKHKNKP